MKSKLHNQLEILEYITHTEKFKGIYCFIIIVALYGAFGIASGQSNIFDGIIVTFQFSIFNILFFSLLFFNTINTCSIFEKKFNFYIIRLESRKRYIIDLLKLVLISNLYLLLLFFMIYIVFLTIVQIGKYNVHVYYTYNISNSIFMIFYMIRYILFSLLIESIFTFIITKIQEKKSIFLVIIFLIGFLVFGTTSEIQGFQILPWKYFDFVNYGSFNIEVMYSIIYLLILEVIIILLISLYSRPRRKYIKG